MSAQLDLRLRRRILLLLQSARVNEGGWVGGRFLRDVLDAALPPPERPEDDEHLIALLHDLVRAALADQQDTRTRKSQPYVLDWQTFRITPKGSALIQEHLPPDPLVDDDRK